MAILGILLSALQVLAKSCIDIWPQAPSSMPMCTNEAFRFLHQMARDTAGKLQHEPKHHGACHGQRWLGSQHRSLDIVPGDGRLALAHLSNHCSPNLAEKLEL